MADADHKRMLEMAAKAFWGDEIDDVVSVEWSEQDNSILYTHADNQDHNGLDRTYRWNPLADDGDALRLAVKLRLVIHVWDDGQTVSTAKTLPDGEDPPDCSRDAWHSADAHACGGAESAARLAIVAAAAAIGEQMP